MEIIKDKTRENNKAAQNPETVNPGEIKAAKLIIKALITKVNKPKVKMFKGRVKNNITGFTTKFIKDKIITTNRAAK